MAKKIGVIGAGGWGTALGVLLAENGNEISLYEHFPEYADRLRKDRENKTFLPGVRIPAGIKITSSLSEALKGSGIIIFAVPSKHLPGVLKLIDPCFLEKGAIFVSAIKGIDRATLKRMSQLISGRFGKKFEVAVLSGPSHAEEVGRKTPTAVVVAAEKIKTAEILQKVFSGPYFRVYASDDVVGVELGGAVKNVIALAKGVLDGMGLGDNTTAALMTRGLAEMKRLGSKLGARPETLNGLSGTGDLIVTCMSRHSRNRSVGERLGKGEKLAEILSSMKMVAEGVTTADSCHRLAKKLGVEMPIVKEMHRILFKGASPEGAVKALMGRKLKREEL